MSKAMYRGMSKSTYYKVLGENRQCFHGGHGQWPEPGTWTEPVRGDLKPCQNGYHFLARGQLIFWLGPTIWEVEPDNEILVEPDKCVTRRARLVRQLETWNDKTARLFAADCAEHVLHIFENKFPDDKRPRIAIQAARDFAMGKITTAAWDAARAGAWAAVWDVGWDAAGDAARDAAWDAGWDVAGDAARAAAWDAAVAAGWDAERNWQTEKLFEYLCAPNT